MDTELLASRVLTSGEKLARRTITAAKIAAPVVAMVFRSAWPPVSDGHCHFVFWPRVVDAPLSPGHRIIWGAAENDRAKAGKPANHRRPRIHRPVENA